MGSAVARSLGSRDIKTFTCLAGRSQRSRELAHAAGMTVVDDLSSLLERADILLSIMPPAAALKFSQEVCPAIAASAKVLKFLPPVFWFGLIV